MSRPARPISRTRRARLCLSRAGSYGPGRQPVDDPASAALKKGITGDRTMTERFCAEILEERAPALAIMWLSEPDYTGHHSPLGSPEHRRAIAGADQCARQVFEDGPPARSLRQRHPLRHRLRPRDGDDHPGNRSRCAAVGAG